MRSKFIAALCLIVSLSLLCSVSAYAVSGSEAETVLTYIKNEDPAPVPDTSPGAPSGDNSDDDEHSRPVYEVVIPAEESMSNGSTLPIYLSENNIPEGYVLGVYIDSARSYGEDGLLHLTGTKGQADALVIVNRYDRDGSYMAVTQQSMPKVAVFEPGNIRPAQYGTLFFSVIDEEQLPADTYTGRIYFNFVLEIG